VLEWVPARGDPEQRALTRLRTRLRQAPTNAQLAAELARAHIAIARRDGDPRHLGYAQAVLGPWWALAAPPPEVRLLRATILQSSHRFDASLRDLDALVRDGGDAQAWLTRATVQQVMGDFAGAGASCRQLAGRAHALVAQACLAGVGSLSGAARPSYQSLLKAYASAAKREPGVDEWVLTLLGEMASRLGDTDAAEQHFRAALALAPQDSYLLGAYADFLLDQGRPRQAAALLQGRDKADALLLRRVIALDRLKDPNAEAARALLRARMQAAQERGDTVYQREHARQALHLDRDPSRALRLARANWAVQKEPADLRILLESALAARHAPTIAEAMLWLDKVGMEDAALATLKAGAAAFAKER
jgi:tetratricopeptide (TPR) repeat protein